jgi:bidirectional [NiFe] hydrogenase diaphorase subunit
MRSLNTKLEAPSEDKRWRIITATMRRHGFASDALIETLHSVQEAFGYIDDDALRFVSAGLELPPSRVFGAATFYNYFTLKPQGEHTCVVCLGTACYIKGSGALLDDLKQRLHVSAGGTTADRKISLLTARCVGACGLAPVLVMDGAVVGDPDTSAIEHTLSDWSES